MGKTLNKVAKKIQGVCRNSLKNPKPTDTKAQLLLRYRTQLDLQAKLLLRYRTQLDLTYSTMEPTDNLVLDHFRRLLSQRRMLMAFYAKEILFDSFTFKQLVFH
mmetsp:Transcript_21727/g.36705  ORF Transcript_21727/g.36705 Transcript_21727/m.36705 type:complete len:104 (-) Transcript_21727:331-642(-)